ncbi:unnamed protein product [Litomosoides sigmodontis]|uniref:Uncharacterized protein n=1 Tax=Litomosoides sigmodontis TaxID=42156 RepID=A0A3P6TYH7_LITSI|nr:unnamed protein product [Litomosoides sigmodontis]
MKLNGCADGKHSVGGMGGFQFVGFATIALNDENPEFLAELLISKLTIKTLSLSYAALRCNICAEFKHLKDLMTRHVHGIMCRTKWKTRSSYFRKLEPLELAWEGKGSEEEEA